MHIVILSGGSGKRLWPLSNEVRSKQFIKAFRGPSGELESMVQRVYRELKKQIPEAGITITTSANQASQLKNQLGSDVDICVEPVRRDTFPAVALVSLYLKDVLGIDEKEAVVVCPVDPYADDGYFKTIREIGKQVETGANNLVLMGITPTYPSEKYGYITVKEGKVTGFKEKPDLETAKELFGAGALWNGGIFGFRLGYMLCKAKSETGYDSFSGLKSAYESLKAVSFDYAVSEKETDIACVTYDGDWKDLGTWNMFTEVMAQNTLGKVRTDETCVNTHVINELDVPILVMGLKDTVVAASADGILISDKGRSSHMKPYVEEYTEPVRFAEKSWGSYRVLDIEEESMTVKVTLMPGHSMNYHSHERRDERWNVLSGTGTAVVDGVEQRVAPGDMIWLPRGCRHTVKAETTLIMMEIQYGTDIDVADKIKHKL